MTDIKMNVPFPLDDEGFFRRECPFCFREFKIKLKEDELSDLAQGVSSTFMVDSEPEPSSEDTEDQAADFFCPYCGQSSAAGTWWTQEQLAYIQVHTKNIVAKIVNENFIGPLKRNFGQNRSGGLISIKVTAKELEQTEPWIAPEANDMKVFDLECCQRSLKIDEAWRGTVHCFFCGFPHG
ncbi:MAG TPA: hypothetical protein VEF34_10530 [Syntrophobacteraceae bacterium]|nr:hypothetical protein [Syntrophobacteraceae bacterium]